MNTPRFPRTLVTLLLLAAAAASGCPAHAVDSWTRVASGGLGDAARAEVFATVVHGGYVWVAAGRRVEPHLFRARLTHDTDWTDVTPPWGASATAPISDLESFGGYIYVATEFGRLWRQRLGGPWVDVTPWPGTAAIHALAVWELTPGTSTLCAVRGSAEVSCAVETGVPMRLPRPPLRDTRPVASGQLHGFRDQLLLGVGGDTAESRTCEVLSYRRGWTVVSDDCFGDETRTWPGGMSVFGEHVYMGTGGHGTNAIVRITPAGEWSEVTPDFYEFVDFGARPARFASTAVAAGYLFVGVHMLDALPGFSQVVRTPDGNAWDHSAEPSFGPGLTNDSAYALASQRLLVYAAAHNHVAGFEVWRRNFLIAEMIDESSAAYRDLIVESRRQALCLRLRIRGCPSRLVIAERFATLKEGVDTARHPDDDAKLILVTRQRFAAADKELAAALELADQGDKMAIVDPGKAKVLYLQAAQRLESAMKTTRAAWEAVVAAQRPGKG